MAMQFGLHSRQIEFNNARLNNQYCVFEVIT